MSHSQPRMSYSRLRYKKTSKPILNYSLCDSPRSDDSSFHDASMESAGSSPIRDRVDDQSSDCLDTDMPSSPIQVSSPTSIRRITRSRRISPLPFALDDADDDEDPRALGPSPSSSPPHRGLRALRLFDTPHTPKSLVQKAQRRRITGDKLRKRSELNSTPRANVNPFTPIGNLNNSSLIGSCGGKRSRSFIARNILDESTEDEMEEELMPSSKKIALREINTSRYKEEFHEVCKLGDGEFGSVCKCVHRLDGCTYAIKKSKAPVAGSVYERNAMNEVYAHAVLGKHPHVVRYYSAWSEEGHMFIQNEYCNGGSLADTIEELKQTGKMLPESDIRTILFQVSQGLRYIHSQNLLHLDVKPGNIFIHKDPQYDTSPESGLESCEEDEEYEESTTYKIGDLGHVTSIGNPSVEEGDCRYLPKEILDENHNYLTKSDIFSLGLTIYEAASVTDLPKNGESWHTIRRGEIAYLPLYSYELNSLLKMMIHPDPSIRPSALYLSQHALLCPQTRKTKAQLRKELNEERFKNELLSRQLQEATKVLSESSSPISTPNTSLNIHTSHYSGACRMKRSMSLSAF